jgi:hypothetical protein
MSVQHEIFRNTVIELAYVGSRGLNQLKFYDVNQVPDGDQNRNGLADRLEYAQVQGGDSGASLRPYGSLTGNNRILIWGHGGSTTYHSLQTQLVSRFGRGSQFQTSYTWSKSLGDVPLDDSGNIVNDNSVTGLENQALDWGRTKTHRTHVFNASLVLVLPSFEDKGSFVKNVLGDWEFTTIAAAASGQALSVYTGGIPGLNGGPSGTGYTDNQRPNRVEGTSCKVDGGPKEQILNPAAFTLTGFNLGTIGNSGRGICDGPGLFQVDVGFFKNIKAGNRVKIQLRFELFNVFNTVNFFGTGGQGVINTMNPSSVTLNDARSQITGYTLPGNFGQAVAARDPRQAQFGIKLTF